MKKYFLILVSISSFVLACRKEKTDIDNTVTQDNSTAENYFADMFKVVDNVSTNTQGIRDISIGCIDTIIVDTTVTPRTMIVDFGTDDCVGNDLRIRKGKLNITFTGRYRDPGTVITVTPENYTVDGFLLQGTKTITNNGTNASGQPYFSVSVANGSITAPSNLYTITWNSTRTRTWVAGANTATILDDVYEITGGATGTNRFGNGYTMTIQQPLRAELACRWLTQGTILMQPSGAPERTINFGSGECNNGFTVTVGDNTYEISGGN